MKPSNTRNHKVERIDADTYRVSHEIRAGDVHTSSPIIEGLDPDEWLHVSHYTDQWGAQSAAEWWQIEIGMQVTPYRGTRP